MPDITLLAGAAILFAAGIASWFGARKAQRAHIEWCAGKTRATGTVSRVGLRNHLSRNAPTSDEEKVHSTAVVQFKAANGVQYEIDAPEATQTVGAAVEVAYDPALPSDARAVQRTPKIGCAVVFVAIAFVLLALAFLQG